MPFPDDRGTRRGRALRKPALRRSLFACALLFSSGGPAAADEISDLQEQMRALTEKLRQIEAKQNASDAGRATPAAASDDGKGSFPRSFKIPGTDTSLRVGGYVKLDAIYDVNAPQGDQTSVSTIPLSGSAAASREGSTRLHARQSRVLVETETPTATSYGPIKTLVEGDFFGAGGNEISTNSSTFRLRHAMGTFGPILAGQYWSNFIDPDSYVETLDFSGPAGQTFLRQGQLRYTQELGPGTKLSGAIENPEGDFFANPASAGNNTTVNGGQPSTGGNNLDKYPDVTLRLTTKNEWGQFSFAGVVRDVRADVASGAFAGRKAETVGYGLSAQGVIHAGIGKDQINYQVNGGPGIGRYQLNATGSGANFDATSGHISAETSYGFYVGYRHWWSEKLRSNLVYGYDHIGNDTSITGTGVNRMDQDVHVNLIWSPIAATNFGVEYIYGSRETEADQKGFSNRVQASAQYSF